MEQKPFWHILEGLTPYQTAIDIMQKHHAEITAGTAAETVFLLTHPPLYSAGTSAKEEDLLPAQTAASIQIIRNTGRGGQWTYHGPGQRIIWPVLNLNTRKQDLRAYIFYLEAWVMHTLKNAFGVETQRREGKPGLWVSRKDLGKPEQLDKIAAIGVRISRWVTMHGMAVNIDPDLSHYDGIIACGVTDGGITSLAELGHLVSEAEFDMALQDTFHDFFGPDTEMGPSISAD